MIDWNEITKKITPEDSDKLLKIANKITNFYGTMFGDTLTVFMDLEVTHAKVGLRLDEMLTAVEYNPNLLHHDLVGLHKHLDRKTGEIGGCFMPRFAA